MVGELKAGDKIVIATHNEGKAKELAELFASVGVETVSAGELGLPVREVTDAIETTARAVLKKAVIFCSGDK